MIKIVHRLFKPSLQQLFDGYFGCPDTKAGQSWLLQFRDAAILLGFREDQIGAIIMRHSNRSELSLVG